MPATDTIRTVDRLEDVPAPPPTAAFVVVDVIIASTSIVRLLEGGARYVKPFGDAADALAFKDEVEDAVLVGEDRGGPIDGFDCSPLPSILASADLDDRPVGIRTTNGTRAIERLGRPDGLLIGSTVNAAAVADALVERDREAWVVAAGRRGSPTPEDVAGATLVERCYRGEIDDDAAALRDAVRTCATADWLRDLGFGHEVAELLAFNSSDTVPRLDGGVFVAD